MNVEKNQSAVELGKLGGIARAKSMTQEQRIRQARKAGKAGAKSRWAKKAEKPL